MSSAQNSCILVSDNRHLTNVLGDTIHYSRSVNDTQIILIHNSFENKQSDTCYGTRD